MIAEAVLGIAAGASLAGALAGLGRIRNGARAMRIVVVVTSVLLMLGAPIGLFSEFRDRALPLATIGTIIIAFGGLAATLSADDSPAMLLASGLLLSYATLALKDSAIQPLTLVAALSLVLAVVTLPALRASAREWRAGSAQFKTTLSLWCLTSVTLAASVATNLLERGAWFGSTPGAAWLLGAWIASSCSLLMRHRRARAALLFVSALAIAFGATSA